MNERKKINWTKPLEVYENDTDKVLASGDQVKFRDWQASSHYPYEVHWFKYRVGNFNEYGRSPISYICLRNAAEAVNTNGE